MKELIFVKVTEVNQFYGNMIRETKRKFENYKGFMFYVLTFIATHDAEVDSILSDRIGLTYYDAFNELIEVVITFRTEGSE